VARQRLSAGDPTVNYNICHAESNERGTKVKSIERKQMSIVFHAAKQRLPHRIFFFFSNRRPEDAPFLAELQALQKENPNYTCIPTMTDMAKSHHQWSGETGYINEEMMAKYLGAAKSPIYYIVGPPKMVSGLHSMINESGVNDDDIRTEDFSGY
jgi:Na+-transporting NADH:ubiquinone oxidoreductase subunit NqrF